MEIIIRVAEQAEAHAVAEVLRRSIIEVCHPDHHGDSSILEQWLANKTATTVAQWLASPKALALLAVNAENEPVGIGMLNRSGEVLLCYVVPEVLGRGVGHSLLSAMLRTAERWGLGRVFLESTETAKSFYCRNGFEPDGEPVKADGLRGYPMQRPIVFCNNVDRTTEPPR